MDELSGASFRYEPRQHLDREGLEHYLGRRLSEWESIYGRDENALMVNDRLESLIKRAFEQTGQRWLF